MDGRSTKVETGPASKNGGFNLSIYQNDQNQIVNALDIIGTSMSGEIKLTAIDPEDHSVLFKYVSVRNSTDKIPILLGKSRFKYESNAEKKAAIRYFDAFEKLSGSLTVEELNVLFGRVLSKKL